MRQCPKPEQRKIRVEWCEVPYEACAPAQRAAWDWLWQQLLSPIPPETTKAPGAEQAPRAHTDEQKQTEPASVTSAGNRSKGATSRSHSRKAQL
jgi:hypothetical protein